MLLVVRSTASALVVVLAMWLGACLPDERVVATAPLTASLVGDTLPACSVSISGRPIVCLDCEREKSNQPSTVLTATGDPGGGTFRWEVTQGADKVSPTARAEKLFVKGKAASAAKEDVTVKVTYQVGQQTCENSTKLTVVKPTSLRLVDEWLFIVEDGKVTQALKNGQPQAIIPPNVAQDLARAREQQGLDKKNVKDIVGTIVIRYYEVLDQFKDLWKCDGVLTEEITPGQSFKKGGTNVKQGIPEHPDRLFNLEVAKKFQEKTILQLIKVSGCEVRYNKFTFKTNSVTSQELTKEKYQQELNNLGKKK